MRALKGLDNLRREVWQMMSLQNSHMVGIQFLADIANCKMLSLAPVHRHPA